MIYIIYSRLVSGHNYAWEFPVVNAMFFSFALGVSHYFDELKKKASVTLAKQLINVKEGKTIIKKSTIFMFVLFLWRNTSASLKLLYLELDSKKFDFSLLLASNRACLKIL